jgi:hypothetical protein
MTLMVRLCLNIAVWRLAARGSSSKLVEMWRAGVKKEEHTEKSRITRWMRMLFTLLANFIHT